MSGKSEHLNNRPTIGKSCLVNNALNVVWSKTRPLSISERLVDLGTNVKIASIRMCSKTLSRLMVAKKAISNGVETCFKRTNQSGISTVGSITIERSMRLFKNLVVSVASLDVE